MLTRAVRWFGSIRIAVVLLTIILVVLAAGTIVESARGSAEAQRLVYLAGWFRALLAVFALNLACSLVDLWPWGRDRIGFVLTHGAMLLVLGGALLTDRYKVEGRLVVWEGEERAAIAIAGPAGDVRGHATLPFAIRLDAFEIDYYQGTARPAMFRSRVTVRDLTDGRTFPAVIEMNRELSHAGYRVFQSGYQQGRDRDQSVLLVSRDPGQALVFGGYGLLMAGMLTVLGTRIAQRAAGRARLAAERARVGRRAAAAAVAGLLFLGTAPGAARAADPEPARGGEARGAAPTAAAPGLHPAAPETLDALRRLPVQHDGRVMPLDTLAREGVWKVTGDWRWEDGDPVATVMGWTFEPYRWAAAPVVRIGGRDLAGAIGLPPSVRRASFNDLVRNGRFLDLLGRARAAARQERPLADLERRAFELEERLLVLQGFLNRERIRPIPPAGDRGAAWSAPPRLDSPADLLAARAASAGVAEAGRIDLEVAYNRARPSRLAWWVLAPAAAAALLSLLRPRRLLDGLALAGLIAGFGVMTWGIWARWQAAARIPASNMYESLLFLGWGVGLFAVAALLVPKSRLVVFNAAAMAALTMALTDLLPLDRFIHPMPPVLSGTPWLAIHVPIIMVSYSVLALGVLIAHMQIGLAIAAPRRGDLASKMNDLLYWYLHVGSILLIAGILTGSIWAASSWGRYWGWDPKEVWSLVAFLAYVAILHGRFDRLIGPFGAAALSIVAFWTILMTYLGVNFILAAGLHAYGFGGSGVVRWLAIIGLLEAGFLAAAWVSRSRRGVPLGGAPAESAL
jgi:cytochrome c-type biogenesis protein CcsB